MDTVPDPPERDEDVYSDEEGAKLLLATRIRERKGPSRSVSVGLPIRLHLQSTSIPNNVLDTDRRMVDLQR